MATRTASVWSALCTWSAMAAWLDLMRATVQGRSGELKQKKKLEKPYAQPLLSMYRGIRICSAP